MDVPSLPRLLTWNRPGAAWAASAASSQAPRVTPPAGDRAWLPAGDAARGFGGFAPPPVPGEAAFDFAVLDGNRDGYLSGTEIPAALAHLAYQAADGRRIVTAASLKAGPNPQPVPLPPPPVPQPAPAPAPQPWSPPPAPAPGPQPVPGGVSLATYEAGVGFFKFDAQKAANVDGVLGDIERHLPAKFGGTYRDTDPITWGHETTHGINSHLRNTRDFNPEGAKVNGFYALGDKAVVLEEPPIRKSSVVSYVPPSLKGGRAAMYITGQQAFEREPLYLMDEWMAYTNGGAVGVDLAKRGKWTQGSRDGVAGVVEFTGYGFAMAMAVEAQQPGYLAAHPKLKNLIAWQGLRAMDVVREGLQVPAFASFPGQHTFYQALQSAPDAEPLRAFIRTQYGDAYLQRMLNG